jgi:hypothetical protein
MTYPTPDPTHADDVDRVFAKLEHATLPDDFTRRVLARTTERPSPRPWMVAGLAALALLTVAGYQLGAVLATTDGLDVIEAVLADQSLLTTAPGDVAAALGEVIPWRFVVIATASAACLILAAGRLASRRVA